MDLTAELDLKLTQLENRHNEAVAKLNKEFRLKKIIYAKTSYIPNNVILHENAPSKGMITFQNLDREGATRLLANFPALPMVFGNYSFRLLGSFPVQSDEELIHGVVVDAESTSADTLRFKWYTKVNGEYYTIIVERPGQLIELAPFGNKVITYAGSGLPKAPKPKTAYFPEGSQPVAENWTPEQWAELMITE